jgi:hypothetical protein
MLAVGHQLSEEIACRHGIASGSSGSSSRSGRSSAVEIYALCTDWRRTLSAAVWHFEHFRAGQPVTQWSAAHFLFIGVLFLTDVWLLGHFALGWWRS